MRLERQKTHRKAGIALAQETPRDEYICVVKSGKAAPNNDLRSEFAAMTLDA